MKGSSFVRDLAGVLGDISWHIFRGAAAPYRITSAVKEGEKDLEKPVGGLDGVIDGLKLGWVQPFSAYCSVVFSLGFAYENGFTKEYLVALALTNTIDSGYHLLKRKRENVPTRI